LAEVRDGFVFISLERHIAAVFLSKKLPSMHAWCFRDANSFFLASNKIFVYEVPDFGAVLFLTYDWFSAKNSCCFSIL
jgi:hypothetical protein